MVLGCQLVPLPLGVQVEMFAFLALAMLLLYLVAIEFLMPPWEVLLLAVRFLLLFSGLG